MEFDLAMIIKRKKGNTAAQAILLIFLLWSGVEYNSQVLSTSIGELHSSSCLVAFQKLIKTVWFLDCVLY